MKSLSKDDFISAIESLQLQVSKDIDNSNTISKVFDTDAVYDNSLLVKAVIKLLQVFFPKDENGFCEIEYYCFDMNFGKVSDQELITPEDLWDRLNYDSRFKPSAFLLDEAGQWPGANKIARLTKKTDVIPPFDVTIGWSDKQGTPIDLRSTEPIPSTHPLIDDYDNNSKHFLSDLTPSGFKPRPLTLPIPKQETIFDIIEREKEDAHEMIKQNNLYGHCFANERFFQGRIHALESIEKVLKSK